MKKLIFPLSLILLVISLAGATFLGTGTYYLVSEKVFQMNEYALQTTQEEEEVRTLLEELEKNLDTKLVKYFLEHGEDEGDTDSYLALRLSEWILQIGMEEGWDAAKAAAKKYHVEYYVKHENGRLIGGNLSVDELSQAVESIVPYHPDTAEAGKIVKYRVHLRFDKEAFQRILLQNYQLQSFWIKHRYAVAGGFVIAFIVSGVLLVLACRRIRRKTPDRETKSDRLPLDLTIALGGAGVWYLLRRLYLLLLVFRPGQVEEAVGLGAGAVFLLLAITFYAIWRFRHRGWHRGTLCFWIWTWIRNLILSWREIFENLSLTWKLLLFELFLYLTEAVVIAIFFYWEDDLWRVLCALALVKVALIPWLLRVGIAIGKISVATHELAQGRYDAQIDVSRLPRPMQGLGEDVNSMAGSISVAVEEQLRSERLKTELITNVSHDIKTPLTSIINFSDMI
ncbi:MAG: HAMP domain-containing histidine kinase, partial [Lachnospiraceae bacterium]|nr:HAMP domain-containing histidine kinase [Lachnospiraceae bacterium]